MIEIIGNYRILPCKIKKEIIFKEEKYICELDIKDESEIYFNILDSSGNNLCCGCLPRKHNSLIKDIMDMVLHSRDLSLAESKLQREIEEFRKWDGVMK